MKMILVCCMFIFSFFSCESMSYSGRELDSDCMLEITTSSFGTYSDIIKAMNETTKALSIHRKLNDKDFVELLGKAVEQIDAVNKIKEGDDDIFSSIYHMSSVESAKYDCLSKFAEVYATSVRKRLEEILKQGVCCDSLIKKLDEVVF